MSEQSQVASRPPPIDPNKKISVQISYCPTLGLYHYVREDGEYFFSNEQMEKSINAFLADGKTLDAEYMAWLTGMSRSFPHKICTIFQDLTFDVRPPEPQPKYHAVEECVPVKGEPSKLKPPGA
jgi:hypothetical protein